MEKFKAGDHVRWNSEAGYVTGRISKIHHSDFAYKGHPTGASKDEPQYEIKSDKTDHMARASLSTGRYRSHLLAAHKETALAKFA